MMKALLALMTVATIAQLTTAATYTVGAPSGSWNLNTNLTQWAASNTFHPGDVLTFSYSSSAHDVLEVTKSNHDSCTTSSPISTDTSGNTVISLANVGTRYFICGFPGHCSGGMKVAIDVVSSSSSSPPPTSGSPTTPVPSTPASPSPTASSPGTSPPSGSSASSTVAGFGLGLGLAALLVL